MAHGGYDKRRVAGRKPANKTTASNKSSLGVEKKPKAKLISLKRQIRSTDRLLRKDTRPEVKEALEKKLEGLKSQQRTLDNLALERKLSLRYKKIKFFERRKLERNIRRLEKQQRTSSGQAQEVEIAEQLSKLKEDLEYVRFFPKTEKYISLFKKGENTETIDKRNSLRKQIKENIAAAVASGKDLEETGSDDDGVELSEDDFFLSSSDEPDADDELTDKSAREQASSASGKAASEMSSDERNQRHISARALMPPPRASKGPNATHVKPRSNSFQKNSYSRRADMSSSSNTSTSVERPSYKNRRPLESYTHTGNSSAYRRPLEPGTHTGNSGSNLSSNSDARKPKRKRRPKKKKQQA
uniref:rRNA-processing protein EFG1 n=1 Tax=Erigeron canadensis TaxID=72917 RepID=UPI001CB9756A|nr:rRNA-processing protein EFG1 [Erigeron canadensis]